MPESKTDQAHRSLEEVSNFLECGDARGRKWLDSHPDAQQRATQQLLDLAHQHDDGTAAGQTPQQRSA